MYNDSCLEDYVCTNNCCMKIGLLGPNMINVGVLCLLMLANSFEPVDLSMELQASWYNRQLQCPFLVLNLTSFLQRYRMRAHTHTHHLCSREYMDKLQNFTNLVTDSIPQSFRGILYKFYPLPGNHSDDILRNPSQVDQTYLFSFIKQ